MKQMQMDKIKKIFFADIEAEAAARLRCKSPIVRTRSLSVFDQQLRPDP